MATTQRQYPGSPIGFTTSRLGGLSGASTGNKLTYTVPAGRQAVVRIATIFPTAGAATIGFKASLSGNTVTLSSGTVAQLFAGGVLMDAADTFSLNVSVLDAASLFDGVICAEEYLAQ